RGGRRRLLFLDRVGPAHARGESREIPARHGDVLRRREQRATYQRVRRATRDRRVQSGAPAAPDRAAPVPRELARVPPGRLDQAHLLPARARSPASLDAQPRSPPQGVDREPVPETTSHPAAPGPQRPAQLAAPSPPPELTYRRH